MSEIKQAGFKGYIVMGIFIALLLFVVLVVYIYKANGDRVPADPMYYGQALWATGRSLLG